MRKLRPLALTAVSVGLVLIVLFSPSWLGASAELLAPAMSMGSPDACSVSVTNYYTVTKTTDTDGTCTSADCSLREAIKAANSDTSRDRIAFDISGSGPFTITPSPGLPTITNPVVIDGYTQSGAVTATVASSAVLQIVIDGSNAGDGANGLVLKTNDSAICGLNIHSFKVDDITDPKKFVQGNGIVIRNGMANTIAGNFIGTNVTGDACVGNGGSGVLIGGLDSTGHVDGNTVGGTGPEDRNIITCNGFQRDTTTTDPDDGTSTAGDGVTIQGSENYSADSNTVLGNYIGLDVTGMMTLTTGIETLTIVTPSPVITHTGNTGNGVRIAGGSSNVVGGTTSGARNIISGNEQAGVRIDASVTDDLDPPSTRPANSNIVQGNYIGTDKTGTVPLGNSDAGVYIVGLVNDADGNQIGGSTNTTPAGPCTGACNLLSGNRGTGVSMLGGEASSNDIQGNFIGTNVTGTVAISNVGGGIALTDAMTNTIGGTSISGDTRNLVSGNGGHGIAIVNTPKRWDPDQQVFLGAGDASANVIQGNFIGTVVSGTAVLSNTLSGIQITDAGDNEIGGTTNITSGGPCTGQCNLIAGNAENGITLLGTGAPQTAETNVVTAEGEDVNTNSFTDSDGATVTIGGGSGITLTKTATTTHVTSAGTLVTFTVAITNTSGFTVSIDALSDSVHGNLNGQGTCSVPQMLSDAGGTYTCAYSAPVFGLDGTSETNVVTAVGTNSNGDSVYRSDSSTVGVGATPPITITKTASPVHVNPPGGAVTIYVTVTADITVTINQLWDTLHGDLSGVCAALSTINAGDTESCSFSASVSGGISNTIEGNFIGTDVNGTTAVPNGGAGILAINAPDNTIGTGSAGNLISGNTREGVALLGPNSARNLLQKNLIGTQADGTSSLGNGLGIGFPGVFVAGDASDNDIGPDNVIWYNGGDGVFVFAGTSNQILSNSIYTNTELGIDLGTDNAVTPNDDMDPDAGANNLQNFPLLTAATAGSTQITGTLNSSPNMTFTLQFFSNSTCDPSGFGEGETFLGSEDIVRTDGSGDASFNVSFVTDVLSGHFITAMATDPFGNTSESSRCIKVNGEPDLAIEKQAQDLNGGDSGPGDTLRYTITYTNTGDAPATGVFITDDYSDRCAAVTNVITDTNFISYTNATGTLRWPPDTTLLFEGVVGSLGYDCTLEDPFTVTDTVVTNTVTIDANEPVSDTDTVTRAVEAAPVLTIDKQVQPAGAIPAPGDVLTYTLSYTNTGDASASGVVITDTYSTHCITISDVITDTNFISYTNATGALRWPEDPDTTTLAAGASGTLEYACTLEDAFPVGTSDVENTATIDSNQTAATEDTVTLFTACFDFDGDDMIDIDDLEEVKQHWRLTPAHLDWGPQYDIDEDGVITIRDILAVSNRLGTAQTCP